LDVKQCYSSWVNIESLIEVEPQLASLPDVYFEFRRAVESPDLDFERIKQVILKDSHLIVRLLKIVNSSFYSFSSKIETISHAISVIGTEQLSYLVLSTGIMDKFSGIPQDVIDMESYWRHSIACGLVSKKLAEYKGEFNSEQHFMFGMLHDIGRLIMCINIPNRNWEVLIRSNSDKKAVYLTEAEELGFDHAQLGGALLRKWNLPKVYQEVVEFHHDPSGALLFPFEVAHCHLADIIANTLNLGCSGESAIVPELDEHAWAMARPPQSISLTVIKDKVEEVFEETASVFLSH
jgi:HD-like signal output (HDOD) protein